MAKKEAAAAEQELDLEALKTKLEEVRDGAIEALSLLGGESAEGGESEAADAGVEFPESEEAIKEMDDDAVEALAKSINLDIEGKKIKAVKLMLTTILAITQNDGVDKLDDDDVNDVAESLGLKVGKKVEQTIEAIKEFFTSTDAEAGEKDADAGGGEAEVELEVGDEVTGENDDKEEVTGTITKIKDDEAIVKDAEGAKHTCPLAGLSKVEGEADGKDNVDREAIAEKFDDFPKDKVMQSRLDEYNEAADEADEIEIKKGKLQEAYTELVAKLVNHEGEVAEWGEAYIADGNGMCCGLPLESVKLPKGSKATRGKCAVTGTVFELDKDNDFVEVKD